MKSCHHSLSKKNPIDDSTLNSFFICPMHENIRQKGPGECSICGMALEPETISIADVKNPELIDFNRRFWIGLILTIPIVFLEMGGHFFDINNMFSNQTSGLIQFILSIPVMFWSGFPFFERGINSIKNRALNMFTLISMGTGIAFTYSVVALFFPNIFPPSFLNIGDVIPIYFEAAAVIIVLTLLGQMLELKARERTSGAIKALLNLAPKTAMCVTKNGDEEIEISCIKKGDHLR